MNPAPLTVTATNESMTYGGTVPALAYTYTGLVNGNTSASFTGGLATTATSSSSVGSYPITQGTLAATGNYTIGTFNPGTLTVTVAMNGSIIVLDPSAGGALSLSGNASINIPGGVYVDSSSSSALSASGNAQIKASVIDVHGGVQKSGNASFSPAPITGAAVLADPLAALASAEHDGPDQLRFRKPERQFFRDDQARHLQSDQRLGQRQAHTGQRHLHHRGGRLLRLGQRQRQPGPG